MFEAAILQSFLAVERTGGFTAAAKDLGLRQSTVSGHVARLEQQVGRQLLHRDTRTVQLTPDGVAMLRFAREILAVHGQARAHFDDSGLAGHVRFGASEDITATGLPDILLDFRRSYPAVDLDLRVGLTADLREDVRAARLDLALVKRRPGEDVGELLFRDRLVWAGRADDAAPADHDASGGLGSHADLGSRADRASRADHADRLRQPGSTRQPVLLVTYPGTSVTRDAAVAALESAGREYRITCVSASQQGIRAAVQAGLGVTVHPASILPPDLVPIDGLPDPGWTEFVLLSRSGPSSVAMDELVQAIRVGAGRIVDGPTAH